MRPDLLQLTELLVLPLVQLVLREGRVEQHVRHQCQNRIEILRQRGERRVGVAVADAEVDRRAERRQRLGNRPRVPRLRAEPHQAAGRGADGRRLRGRSDWRPARRSAPEWSASDAPRAPAAPCRSSAGSRLGRGNFTLRISFETGALFFNWTPVKSVGCCARGASCAEQVPRAARAQRADPPSADANASHAIHVRPPLSATAVVGGGRRRGGAGQRVHDDAVGRDAGTCVRRAARRPPSPPSDCADSVLIRFGSL